ncbi:MAG: LysR substrate-binding domain-containing protein [Amphritea sp.]|nr:LysR substrate-binding domain-containing protein [Amphritea sp.]
MKTDLPPLNWLKTFEAAARLLNFSAAGRELHMTQSAVSQQIRLLEHHLGEPLFLRAHRKVALTNSGLAYLPVVQGAISNLQRNTSEIFSPVGKGRLVIEVSLAFSSLWLANNIHRFSARYPGIGLHLVHANWESEFDSTTVDLAIMHGKGEWQGMHVEPLITAELTPYCTGKLARLLSDPVDLLSLPLLDVVGNNTRWQQWFEHVGINTSDSDILYHRVDNSLTTTLMAESGMGVMLGYPDLLARQYLKRKLQAPFDIKVPTSDNYFLAYPEGKPLSKSASVFCDWLFEELRSPPRSWSGENPADAENSQY